MNDQYVPIELTVVGGHHDGQKITVPWFIDPDATIGLPVAPNMDEWVNAGGVWTPRSWTAIYYVDLEARTASAKRPAKSNAGS